MKLEADTLLKLSQLIASISDGPESFRLGVENLMALAQVAIGGGENPRVPIEIPPSLYSVALVEAVNQVLAERGWQIVSARKLYQDYQYWVEASSPESGLVITKEEELRRCRAYVDAEPGASKGGRKQALIFRVSQLGLDFDLDLDEFEPILISWAERCDPPLDHRAVSDALKWAYKPGNKGGCGGGGQPIAQAAAC